jgi:hypothetical protein
LEGLRKPQNTSVKTAGVSAKICTEYFPNTNLESSCHTNLLGHVYYLFFLTVNETEAALLLSGSDYLSYAYAEAPMTVCPFFFNF